MTTRTLRNSYCLNAKSRAANDSFWKISYIDSPKNPDLNRKSQVDTTLSESLYCLS